MSGKCFVDSNVWVYSADLRETVKQPVAANAIRILSLESRLVSSTQVLNEFTAVALRKLKMGREQIRGVVSAITENETVVVGPDLTLLALDVVSLNSIGFWDALMVVSAEYAGCRYLVTEDLQHGGTIRGIQIWNPFVEPLP